MALETEPSTPKLSSSAAKNPRPQKPKVPNLVIPSTLLGTPQPPPTISTLSTTSPSFTTPSSQKLKVASLKLIPTPQNAVASSSKVLIDRVPPNPSNPHPPIIPNGPRSLMSLSVRAREKSPVISTPLLGGRIHPHAITNTTLPPPDPKALAYIPSGPSLNPLNIRPSANLPARGAVAQKVTPTAPKVLMQPGAKKRIIVGTGWPLAKGPGGANSASTSTSASGPPQPPNIPPPSGPRSLNLSTIISYLSPSPPPSASAVAAANKWRKVTCDIPAGSVEEDCKKVDSNGVIPRASTAPSNTAQKTPQVGKWEP
jgi:hypothetical protein